MHMHVARRLGAGQRAQELRMAGDQMRRQMTAGDQLLFAVDVAQHQVGQLGALDHRRFDHLPSRRRTG